MKSTAIYLDMPVTRQFYAAYPGIITERINPFSFIWPCSRRGLPALPITGQSRGLLHHVFTLTPPKAGRYSFCGTFRRITPPRCYRAPRFCGARTFLTL